MQECSLLSPTLPPSQLLPSVVLPLEPSQLPRAEMEDECVCLICMESLESQQPGDRTCGYCGKSFRSVEFADSR